MLRLSLSLLLVSLVLGMEHSIDDRVTTASNVNPDSALTNNFRQRRRQPYVEIREDNAGRYFRRRPQTTTVPSIFSMKVENESQHVYPNKSPLDNHQVQPKQEEINVMDISTPTTNSNNRRSNNARRRVPYKRTRRPSVATTPSVITQQTEKVTEQVTSTTPAPIIETTEKEQEKVVLPTSDLNASNEDSSLASSHPTISQIPEVFVQRMKEIAEEQMKKTVEIASTSPTVVTSTTTNEPEKIVFTPPTHISHLIAFIKRRRPVSVQITAPTANQEKEANEQAIDATTTAPSRVTIAARAQDKIDVTPPAPSVSEIVSIRPKSRRTFTRGSQRYNRNDIKKEIYNIQESDSNSTTMKTPPPVPTLSPWYDGFGK